MVSIAGATASATVKMLLMCSVIARLVTTRILPSSTAATLSRVVFVVITPCMLFTRLVHTLSGPTDTMLLLALPLAMTAQVALGYALGTLATWIVNRGWHPARNPTRAAKAIAASTALAVGVPQAADALQRTSADSDADRLIVTACAFGNSLTLPLVFLTTLFYGDAASLDAAIARTAIVQIAWYPLVWSVGYRTLVGGTTTEKTAPARTARTADRSATLSAAVANRVGISTRTFSAPRVVLSVVMRLWATLSSWINPPLMGVAAGVLVGGSGAMRLLGTGTLPIELALVAMAAKCVVDVVDILGSAALACQAIVLGASLAEPGKERETAPTARAVLTVSVVRFLVLPAIVLAAVRLAAGWLDPMAAFVLCVQAVMPPAQSLAVMAQLGGVPGTSHLLLRVYLVAVVPVALWVAVFLRVFLVS